MAVAIFGGGCFWCTEAIFERLIGVQSVLPGYAGGETVFPSYEAVCAGDTGHAEVVRIEFDPAEISFRSLVEIFLLSHDPSSKNRQGADVGTQYRSVIFAQDGEQESIARAVIADAEASGVWPNPVVTEIDGAKPFYPATIDHQSYFRRHSSAPYCAMVIAPKLQQLRERFSSKLREPIDS